MGRILDFIGRHRRAVAAVMVADLAALAAVLVLSAGGSGQTIALPTLPTNDLQNLLSLTGTQTPARAPLQESQSPAISAVPAAVCGAGSRPLAGEQGRVPAAAINSPAGAQGWTCNTSEVSHYPTSGGFRVWRYVDPEGHVCAYYDTSIQSPADVTSLALGPSPGVVVLDMSDPAHPVKTAQLTSLPMLSPHESLNLNATRGLLAAELGNAGSAPGLMAIYSLSQDCRHPVLDSTYLAARFGHESGFSSDGRTFWIGGGEGIAAVDVSDPTHPKTLWQGNIFAHGLNLSDDGDTLYDSDPIDGDEILLNVSQIQNRDAHPVVTEISRLTWPSVSIPQNTDPMTIDGHHYLLEFDEFAFRFNPPTVDDDTPGAARIINIDDPSHPYVVSNLRLAVNMPANHAAADGDPSPLPTANFTYSAHYCAIPREVDPEIVACSFINSGLRIFNIQDPAHPREVGYFVAPPAGLGGALKADAAFSQPAFDPARQQVWYTDAGSGFYDVQLTNGIWPDATSIPTSPTPPKQPPAKKRQKSTHPKKRKVKRARLDGRYFDLVADAGRGAQVAPGGLIKLPATYRGKSTRVRGHHEPYGSVIAGHPSASVLWHFLGGPGAVRSRSAGDGVRVLSGSEPGWLVEKSVVGGVVAFFAYGGATAGLDQAIAFLKDTGGTVLMTSRVDKSIDQP